MKLQRFLPYSALAAMLLVWLVYVPLRAQLPAAPPDGVPPTAVTTPVGAASPESMKPSPNVSADKALPVQEVPSPAAPSHAEEQLGWALLVSQAIRYLKKAPWFKLLPEDADAKIHAWFNLAAAGLTAAGIHFGVSGTLLDSGGATLTISGLTVTALKDVLFQWGFQQVFLDTFHFFKKEQA